MASRPSTSRVRRIGRAPFGDLGSVRTPIIARRASRHQRLRPPAHRGGPLMVAREKKSHEYPDDIFADSRMTFGEHIEELRFRMIRALMWLLLFLVLGFVLDAVGEAVGNKNIGIGRPMLEVITEPV